MLSQRKGELALQALFIVGGGQRKPASWQPSRMLTLRWQHFETFSSAALPCFSFLQIKPLILPPPLRRGLASIKLSSLSELLEFAESLDKDDDLASVSSSFCSSPPFARSLLSSSKSARCLCTNSAIISCSAECTSADSFSMIRRKCAATATANSILLALGRTGREKCRFKARNDWMVTVEKSTYTLVVNSKDIKCKCAPCCHRRGYIKVVEGALLKCC